MKELFITLKDPDAAYEAISEYIDEQLVGMDAAEAAAVKEIRQENYSGIIGLYFEYGEYITIAVNLLNKSVRVVSIEELEKNG